MALGIPFDMVSDAGNRHYNDGLFQKKEMDMNTSPGNIRHDRKTRVINFIYDDVITNEKEVKIW